MKKTITSQDSASSQPYIQKDINGSKGVFTRLTIPKSTKILNLAGEIVKQPNRFSLQIDKNRHLTESGEIDDFINHACRPSCRINFCDLSLVAIRDLKSGEELTINYCASEYKIAAPFSCSCGATNCYGVVKGFAFLDDSQRWALEDLLSPYLKRIAQEL